MTKGGAHDVGAINAKSFAFVTSLEDGHGLGWQITGGLIAVSSAPCCQEEVAEGATKFGDIATLASRLSLPTKGLYTACAGLHSDRSMRLRHACCHGATRAFRTRFKEAMADFKVDAFTLPKRDSRWCNWTFSGTTGAAVRARMRACTGSLCAFIAGAGGDEPSPAGLSIVEPWATSNLSCCVGSLSAESGDERDGRMSRTAQEVFSCPQRLFGLLTHQLNCLK